MSQFVSKKIMNILHWVLFLRRYEKGFVIGSHIILRWFGMIYFLSGSNQFNQPNPNGYGMQMVQPQSNILREMRQHDLIYEFMKCYFFRFFS